jgi:hypothetical protein
MYIFCISALKTFMSEKNAKTSHARVNLTLSCLQGHARIRWKTVIDFIITKGFMECLISKLNLPLPDCTRYLGHVSLFQFRFLLFAIQLLYYIVFVNFHFSAFNALAPFSSISSATIATFHALTSRAWRHDKEWGGSRVGKGNYWSWRHDVGVDVNSRVGDAFVE